MIAGGIDPTAKGDFLTNVFNSQLTACMRSQQGNSSFSELTMKR
jgi:hypothetical protein